MGNSNNRTTGKIETVNPANGHVIKAYAKHSHEQVVDKIEQGDKAFATWRLTPFKKRGELMKNAAEVLENNKNEYAELMTKEMGKVFKEGIAEIEKCVWVCRYYADNAQIFLNDEIVQTDAHKSFITFQPLGLILAVMPWNFPFWQVFRFAAPTLMAGNTGILKHASSVTGCALAIENVFKQAGFPSDCFTSLVISSDQVEAVIEHPKVRAVTLTGSTGAGKKVAATAGKNLKKTVLELGGSDPYIVLADADINLAAEKCTKGRLINSGQSCIAAKRFIVVESVYQKFLDAFKSQFEKIKMGDPLNEETDIGPQADADLRDELHKQVEESIKKGANCIIGGTIPNDKGAWYPATILADVKEGMPAYSEELFGPVAAVIRAKNTQEAIDIANSSEFGLGGAIFTKDVERGRKIAREQIESGAVCVNDIVSSDPRLPFGGIKQSGYGRELSYFGIKEFVNAKAVSIN